MISGRELIDQRIGGVVTVFQIPTPTYNAEQLAEMIALNGIEAMPLCMMVAKARRDLGIDPPRVEPVSAWDRFVAWVKP